MTQTIKSMTGTEVVSECTKCKMTLLHIIVAMDDGKIKKVRCRTCGKEHRFLSPDRKRRASPPKVKTEQVWEQLMKPLSSKKKIPYTLSGHYRGNDVIDHPVFGIGVVEQVLSEKKMRVIFKEGGKWLASGRPIP